MTTFKHLLCRLLGHRNDISCIDKNYVYTHDQCSRCGVKLAIAYPPQRKPLTDDEIAEMWLGILYDTPPSGVHKDGLVPHRLARAIERAHGITE